MYFPLEILINTNTNKWIGVEDKCWLTNIWKAQLKSNILTTNWKAEKEKVHYHVGWWKIILWTCLATKQINWTFLLRRVRRWERGWPSGSTSSPPSPPSSRTSSRKTLEKKELKTNPILCYTNLTKIFCTLLFKIISSSNTIQSCIHFFSCLFSVSILSAIVS